MTDARDSDLFGGQLEDLEGAMSEAGAMTAALSGEILKMQGAMAATGRDAEVLSRGLSRGLKRAFDGLVFDGMRASDALGVVARSLVNTAYSAAIKPVTNHLGGLLAQGVAGMFANGGSFSQGRVTPFASGGIVSGPTLFPMRGGTGLMGEAGPEAIMPLTRGADGKLGVRAAGGGRPVQVVMNISTPDATSFQRSQNQIAAQMSRALGRAQRNR
ncbi:MAG: phage tail tape measure protein [Roseovarius confluentis]|uniref:phage tail tape measure protein n=1 Tax=Roseovarius sp. TaxID=1486281 RepID=UPI0032F006AA